MDGSGFQYQDLLNQSVIASGTLIVDTIIFPNLDVNSIPYIDSNNTVDDLVLNDGEIIIGKTGAAPLAGQINGTTNQVNVVNGSGSINLSLPQDIATSSSPTFDNMTLNSLNSVPVSDYIITPSTVDLDMDNHNISNLSSLNGTLVSNYLKTPSTVDLDMNNHFISNFNSLRPVDTNINIGNTTFFPLGGIGNIVLGDLTTVTNSNSVCIGLQNVARGNSVSIGKETIAGNLSTVVGYRSSSGINTNSVVVGHDNVSSGTSADIFGVNRSNSTANSLLLGNGSYVNIRANSICDLGTSSVPFQSIYSNGTLYGTINNRLVNDIVSNSGTGTLNNICSFVSDKVIKDSGIATNTLTGGPFLPLAGGTMTSGATINTNSGSITNLTNLNGSALSDYIITPSTSNLNMNSHSLSGVTTINGKTASDLVTGPASATGGNLCSFFANSGKIITDSAVTASEVVTRASGVSTPGNLVSMSSFFGKEITDSGVVASNVVTNSGSAISGRVATFSSNKVIQDSGTLLSSLVPYTGATTTLAMGSNAVTGSGANTAGSLTLSSTTDSSSIFTGSFVTSGGIGVAKSAYIGSSLYVNTTSATANLVVSGGVQNLPGEDSCIRAISSSGSTKIEIQNTYSLGKLYEIRSASNGTFDVTNRTDSVTLFSIDRDSNFGFNGTSFGNGRKVLFIANASTVPTSNPSGGGLLYSSSGALWYRGSSGTVTQLAPA